MIISKKNTLFNTYYSNLCGMYVESTHLICLNPNCPTNLKMEFGSDELESILNLRLSITDSTGTLENCIIHHQTATKILSKVSYNKKKTVIFRF